MGLNLCNLANIHISFILVITTLFLLIFMIYTYLIYGPIESFITTQEIDKVSELREKISVMEDEIKKYSLMKQFNEELNTKREEYIWMKTQYDYNDPESEASKERSAKAQALITDTLTERNNSGYSENNINKDVNFEEEQLNMNIDKLLEKVNENSNSYQRNQTADIRNQIEF